MKTGYYWIQIEDQIIPAHWDGEKWHFHGQSDEHDHNIISSMSDPQCQTGCVCTQNSDGSWTIKCP